MKVLMDLVAIESESSKERGIGRYSSDLSKTILEQEENDEIKIFLNSLYPEHKETIEEEYKDLIDKKNIIYYNISDISQKTFIQKQIENKLNTALYKEQLLNLKDVELLHFFSVFEGLEGKADIINDMSDLKKIKTVVTIYDLIPLIFQEQYLGNEDVKKFYFKKLRLLYEADLLLAISDATREDAINILGIPSNKVINISGAIDKTKFYKLEKQQINQNILTKFFITQPYIMYTGGLDFRKNLNTSIEAFSKIDKKLFDAYQYVIVCKITKSQKEDFYNLLENLAIPKHKIIFTNYVTDEELNILYNQAKLFIFPSIYEGFGLPILEAINCNTVVIGSKNSSIIEIIERDDCMFDPTNIKEISTKISNILNDEKLYAELQNYFSKRALEFSWEKSAQITTTAYKKLLLEKKPTIKRQKIAFFSPLPNKRSGISDYSLELLPFLSKYMDIDIFIDDNYTVDDDYLKYNFHIFSYKLFDDLKVNYDNIIYQFGNSEFHHYMYDIALKNKGVIVLHDFYLSGLIDYIATKEQNRDFFIENITYSHPNRPLIYHKENSKFKLDIVKSIDELPMNKMILDSAKSIIVHSNYSKELCKKYYKDDYDISQINQLIKQPSQKIIDSRDKVKKLLDFEQTDIIVSAFGHITDMKQYDFILESFAKADIFKNQNIKLFFVGDYLSDSYKSYIQNIIKKYNFKNITITGFVDDTTYKNYLLASDIAINLRVNSRGETSRALLMNMAYALPTIVNDYATFAELPDDTVVKVLKNSQNDFIKKLKELLNDKEKRNSLSKSAYGYIQKYHNIDKIAFDYYKVLTK